MVREPGIVYRSDIVGTPAPVGMGNIVNPAASRAIGPIGSGRFGQAPRILHVSPVNRDDRSKTHQNKDASDRPGRED